MNTTSSQVIDLSAVATLEKGKPPLQQPYFGTDAELYLTPEYLRGGPSLNPVKPPANAVRVEDGDTVVLWDGSNAGEVLCGKQGVLASTMVLIRHDEILDPEYFFFAVKGQEHFLKAQTSGSGIPHVDKEVFGKLKISVFPRANQIKVARILSTVNRAIKQMEALIAKQQRIKTGLMQDLLTRGIDEHGNLRSEQTHQFKDSPLGRIPVDWEVKELNDLVDEPITYGIVQAGPDIENGVPYVRTGDMGGETINVPHLLRTSPQIAESYKRSSICPGDIIFALRATVGKVLPVTEELSGANLTQGTAKISPRESVDSIFLLWAMRTSQVQDVIRLEQKGTTFMEITLGDLRRINLALPKEKYEQSVIGERLELHERLRRGFLEQGRKLQSIKTALMRDLLTGKRRVTKL